MTGHEPPRLALALLERFVPESGPVAGDLVEEFQRPHSAAWFWWQVLAAITFSFFSRPEVIRPLRLVDLQPADALERSRRMSLQFHPVNLTASPVYGIGGLGLVMLSLMVSLVVPDIWLVLLASMVAGVALGVARIAVHRHRAG